MPTLPVKMSDALYARLKTRADDNETSMGEYIRRLLLNELKETSPTPAPDPKQSEFKDDPKTLRRCKELWRDKGYKLPFPELRDAQGKAAKSCLQILESGVDWLWEQQRDEWEAYFACSVLKKDGIFPDGWLVSQGWLDGTHSVQSDNQNIYNQWPKEWWAEQVRLRRTRYDVADEIWRFTTEG